MENALPAQNIWFKTIRRHQNATNQNAQLLIISSPRMLNAICAKPRPLQTQPEQAVRHQHVMLWSTLLLMVSVPNAMPIKNLLSRKKPAMHHHACIDRNLLKMPLANYVVIIQLQVPTKEVVSHLHANLWSTLRQMVPVANAQNSKNQLKTKNLVRHQHVNQASKLLNLPLAKHAQIIRSKTQRRKPNATEQLVLRRKITILKLVNVNHVVITNQQQTRKKAAQNKNVL